MRIRSTPSTSPNQTTGTGASAKPAGAAKARGADGARALSTDEQARMRDAAEKALGQAADRHGGLQERAQAAAAAFAQFTALSKGDDGSLKRSDLAERAALHAAAVGTEAAVVANVAAARVAQARIEASADGRIDAGERAGLRDVQAQAKQLQAQAKDALGRAATMKQAAAKERGNELVVDMTQLAGKTSVADKRATWRGARDRLAEFTAKHGAQPAAKADQHTLSQLKAEKSAAWRNLLAEHGKQKLLDRSAALLSAGKGAIAPEQRAALEQDIAKIARMQEGADKMTKLAGDERLAARGARAQSAASGASTQASSSQASSNGTGARSSTGASSSRASSSSTAGADTAGQQQWNSPWQVIGDALKQAFVRFADGAVAKKHAADATRAADEEAKWAAAREQGFIFGQDAEDAAKGKTGTTLLGLKEIVVAQMKEEPLGRLLARALKL